MRPVLCGVSYVCEYEVGYIDTYTNPHTPPHLTPPFHQQKYIPSHHKPKPTSTRSRNTLSRSTSHMSCCMFVSVRRRAMAEYMRARCWVLSVVMVVEVWGLCVDGQVVRWMHACMA